MLQHTIVLLRWAWVAAEVTLLFVLWRKQLVKQYRWFFALIFVGLCQQLSDAPLDHHSWLYVHVWTWFEIVRLLTLALATLELTRRILEHYPRIATIAVNGFGMLFGFGVMVGTGMMVLFMDAQDRLPLPTYIAFKSLRWVSFCVAGYLIGLMLWFNAFPVTMRRNVESHRWLLALYGGVFPGCVIFLTDWFDANRPARDVINCWFLLLQVACLATWVYCFSRKNGEEWREIHTEWSSENAHIQAEVERHSTEVMRGLTQNRPLHILGEALDEE